MNDYNLKEEIKKYSYFLIIVFLLLNTFVYGNPGLSYLDDYEDADLLEYGSTSTSTFGTIFNIIVWASLFYYMVLHERIPKWVEKWKARKKRKAEAKNVKADTPEDDSIMNVVVIVVFIAASIGARIFFEG